MRRSSKISPPLVLCLGMRHPPGPNTLRVRVTLTGIGTNTSGLAPMLKLFSLGLLINTVDTVQDRQGPLSGSVSFAVEIYDSASNRLLRAYVSKEYPAAENIGQALERSMPPRRASAKGPRAWSNRWLKGSTAPAGDVRRARSVAPTFAMFTLG